jgi:hypothetical protein
LTIEPPLADDAAIELAQGIAQSNPSGQESIGQISALEGTAFITRSDGTKVQASDGTPIFQGDMVETDGSGAIGITFAEQNRYRRRLQPDPRRLQRGQRHDVDH